MTTRFDPTTIEPLDGSPMMSANCWNAILTTVRDAASGSKTARFLEWGAGNSTVNLVRTALAERMSLHLTSVEHETNFFHWLAESVVAEFRADPKGLRVEWRPVRPRRLPAARLLATLRAQRALEGATIPWQTLTSNKRLQYIEGSEPKFGIFRLRTLKQAVRAFQVRLGHAWWALSAAARGFVSPGADGGIELGDAETIMQDAAERGRFFKRFEARPEAGLLTVVRGTVRVSLWHLPPLRSPFWGGRLLLEGSMRQLFDYVGVPLDGRYDAVFIDGRARVSCVKRVHRDGLLERGGTLFVHDAFRTEMMEGFRLFDATPSFVRGSNVTLNGRRRCEDGYGPPLVRVGDAPGDARPEVMQELFFFRNAP